MIPVERLTIVQAERLEPGSFALLPEYGNALAIATWNERNPVVFLTGSRETFRLFGRYDLYGPALVLPDVIIEVSHGTVVRDSNHLGSLSLCNGQIALNVNYQDYQTHAFIKDTTETEHGPRLYFEDWRAVIRDGSREWVLFEKFGAPRADAVLMMMEAGGLLDDIED